MNYINDINVLIALALLGEIKGCTVKNVLCLAGTTWNVAWNKAKYLRTYLQHLEGVAWHDGYLAGSTRLSRCQTGLVGCM